MLTYDEPLLSGTTSIKRRPIFGYEEKKKNTPDSSGGSNSKKVPRVPQAKSGQLTVKANTPYSARLNNENHCCAYHFFKPILVKICIQYLFYSVLTGFT